MIVLSQHCSQGHRKYKRDVTGYFIFDKRCYQKNEQISPHILYTKLIFFYTNLEYIKQYGKHTIDIFMCHYSNNVVACTIKICHN
jgi:hypothetical protein